MSDTNTRADWIARQQQQGNSPRAVLMKGLHPSINGTIDAWHRLVLRHVFSQVPTGHANLPTLDLGCGYGRLAGEAESCGQSPVIGIDFAHKFCVDFQRGGRSAVCGELCKLPFQSASFKSAYSVTALMYLTLAEARSALLDLNRCLIPGARILLLEPSFEFNSLVRSVLRKKRTETLARPGLTEAEMHKDLVPAQWRPVAAGGCAGLTALLPLLLITARFPALYRRIADAALRLSSPGSSLHVGRSKFAMYRWVAYEKGEVDSSTSDPSFATGQAQQ